MNVSIAVLATLDTKGDEVQFLREQIESRGGRAVLIDLGVVGSPMIPADVSREEVAQAGGTPLSVLLENPTRQTAAPVMIAGAIDVLTKRIEANEVQAVIGLGGTQGTSVCSKIMQALPYGFPKIMVSTIASGDTSSFVDIKDITMMFSVCDLLGLNPLLRKILANAAAAACGMAQVEVVPQMQRGDKPIIGVTNLGVLTDGAMMAIDLIQQAGYETIVFHAVGSGGRAMEQLMKEGIIGAVFDYALGEISDELYDGLRAGSPERLTVAGELGLPQVICPGGTEHIGLVVDQPNRVPEKYRDHKYIFHSPIIFAPRLSADEMVTVAREIAKRLTHTKGRACFLIPQRGTSRYGVEGGPLRDPAGDEAFFTELKARLPDSIEVVECDAGAEDPAFVKTAVERLIQLIERK